jgi:hypothetical protein
MAEAASMLAPRVPERREGGSGVGETRDGGGSGLIRPKYPPIAGIGLTHRFLALYPYEARSGPRPRARKIPRPFPIRDSRPGCSARKSRWGDVPLFIDAPGPQPYGRGRFLPSQAGVE